MDVLIRALEHAQRELLRLPTAPVAGPADATALRAALGGPLPVGPEDPVETLDRLVAGARDGIVASPGPRYFGFVTGGAVPAALAADWMTSTWDQNGAFAVMSPAGAVVEEIAAGGILDLLGLPAGASVGFVTGAQMANVSCLAAARQAVLMRAGWDVSAGGLQGAPRVHVIAGAEAHVTVHAALRLLGLGAPTGVVAVDDQGRMRPDDLRRVLAERDGPTIVCAQSGNVNTGACDPLADVADACAGTGVWLHVDGAFGLWAAASPALRHLTAGAERADSWATDGHKWLNTPYDSGIAIVNDPAAHRAALSLTAAYLAPGDGLRDGSDWTPEASRRVRGFAAWAALRSLGRSGVVDLVERCAILAKRMADRLGTDPDVTILNDVVLNQVLVQFAPPGGGDADAFTDAVIRQVQQDGVCWLGGTRWHDQQAMRISVSNWSTTAQDIDRSAEAILDASKRVAAG